MKRILFTFFFVSVFVMAYGQKRTELKGPEAKNYKIWEADKSNFETFHFAKNKPTLTSVEQKNLSTEQKNDGVAFAKIQTADRTRVFGPKAKNRKYVTK